VEYLWRNCALKSCLKKKMPIYPDFWAKYWTTAVAHLRPEDNGREVGGDSATEEDSSDEELFSGCESDNCQDGCVAEGSEQKSPDAERKGKKIQEKKMKRESGDVSDAENNNGEKDSGANAQDKNKIAIHFPPEKMKFPKTEEGLEDKKLYREFRFDDGEVSREKVVPVKSWRSAAMKRMKGRKAEILESKWFRKPLVTRPAKHLYRRPTHVRLEKAKEAGEWRGGKTLPKTIKIPQSARKGVCFARGETIGRYKKLCRKCPGLCVDPREYDCWIVRHSAGKTASGKSRRITKTFSCKKELYPGEAYGSWGAQERAREKAERIGTLSKR